MAIEGGYLPPGVYTSTTFETQNQNAPRLQGRIPTLIGVGRQTIESKGNLLVRGSSASVDQRIVEEDASGRMVLGENPDGSPILGGFDGVANQILVRNFPIVTGEGIGKTLNTPNSIVATLNGNATVVLAVDGANGKITVAEAPKAGDDLRISYFFNRTDTFVEMEDLSAQVSAGNTEVLGSASDFVIDATSNTLIITVDGQTSVLTLPNGAVGDRANSLSRVVASINGAGIATLEASTYLDANGSENLLLTAEGSILVGAGTANQAVGVYTNQRGSSRTRTFFTHFGPIVDGTNSGVTSTDPATLEITVDGVSVVAESVDGANGSFTLALPPKVGAEVKVSYYHNTFRNQFDFLTGRDITSIDRVSLVASGGGASAQFIEGVDFVLSDDKIVWGTASLVSAGAVQEGATSFGANQVSALLRDERAYLLECSSVVNTQVIPPRVLPNTFQLPFQPVDGTGSGTPTRRTDLVEVRTGINLADAMERPAVSVTRVNPETSQITLASSVPASHKVYASFFYSVIQDRFDSNAYTLTVVNAGSAGEGTYTVSHGNSSFFSAEFEGKGVDLSETVLMFPSGSEALAGARMGVGVAVDETVTVQIENFKATPAVFASEGFGPYYLVSGQSDTLEMDIDIPAQAVTVDFSDPTDGRKGHVAHLVSEVLPYAPETDNTAFEDGVSSSISIEVDGELISASISGNGQTVTEWVDALNTASLSVAPKYTAMSPIPVWGATEANGTYRTFKFAYTGDVTASTEVTVTLDPLVNYISASDLASALTTKIADGIALVPALAGLVMSCASDNSGRLVFSLDAIADADTKFAFIEFITDGANDTSFLSIAGIDGDENAGETQTKWGFLPIASEVSTDLDGELRDRLILKNRTFYGDNYHPPVAGGIEIIEGTNIAYSGFSVGQSVVPTRTSVLDAPSLVLNVSWNEEVGGLPAKTFHDGTVVGVSADNVLTLDIGGTLLSTTFEAGNFVNGESQIDINDIALTLSTALNGYATVSVEGAYLRVTSDTATLNSYIKVAEGSANEAFDLSTGDMVSVQAVPATSLVSALMSHSQANVDFKTMFLSVELSGVAGKFTGSAISYVVSDSVGRRYVAFESLSAGNSSVLDVTGGKIATTRGTGLKITVNSGAVGEAESQGFFVTSSNPNGSGSAGTSTLNDGVGEDGRIGQTYIDSVTGFTFTLLERDGGISYPTGAGATLTFKVGTTFTTDANIPSYAIPGVSLLVQNTLDTLAGDTASVETFFKGGSEPDLAQEYYVDFTRVRSRFNTRTFTNLADVTATYGAVSLENTLSLGAYLAFANGAIAVACKQVEVEAGQPMSEDQVIQAIKDIEGEITAGLSPSVIMPLCPMTPSILSYLSNHCDIQSSIRYRSERRAVVGVAPGTSPREVKRLAENTANSRIVIVYPDMANVTFVDENNTTQSYLVGGEFVAVAVANATSNTTFDSATPWTGRTIRGFTSLGRNLDEVDANLVASSGVTVITQRVDGLKVRHGLTTNMTSVLTKTPTVVQIADDVHLRARNLLSSYIGLKYVPQTIQQIEGKVNTMFKQLVRDQIISTYTGLSVTRDANDPTQLNIEVFYKPVFPLLYIQFNFTVQGS